MSKDEIDHFEEAMSPANTDIDTDSHKIDLSPCVSDVVSDFDRLLFGKTIREHISLSEDDEKVDTVTIDVPSNLLFLRIMKAAKETQIEVIQQAIETAISTQENESAAAWVGEKEHSEDGISQETVTLVSQLMKKHGPVAYERLEARRTKQSLGESK
jgi:hypothetical protein